MVRFKNRYIALEVRVRDRPEHAPLDLDKRAVYASIMRKVQDLHGDFGAGAVANGFIAKYCNPYTKIVVVRCRHGPHRFVATTLPLVRKIEGVDVEMRMIYTGGTLSKCYKFIARHQQRTLEKFWNQMKSKQDQLQMKEALLEVEPFTGKR